MIKSYLIIAFRQIWRHPFFSIINIAALSLSLSIGLLVMSLINFQLNYDTFHPDKEKIFRITTDITGKTGEKATYATTPILLRNELIQYRNYFDAICQLRPVETGGFEFEEKKLDFKAIYTSSAFFSVFGFTMNSGSDTREFDEPNTAILSTEAAKRIFGKTTIIGSIIHSKNIGYFKVIGILDPIPGRTHIDYDILLSEKSSLTFENRQLHDSSIYKWAAYYSAYTYIKIKKNESLTSVASVLQKIVSTSFTKQNYPSGELSVLYKLQSILEITPRRAILLDNSKGMSYGSIWLLGIFVFVLLLMACLNYSNLTMARILGRSVEVGMRKVFGANRRQVITQFVIESTVICFIALIFAFAIRPFIPLNEPLRKLLIFSSIDSSLICESVLVAIFAGLFSGVLPSYILSKLKPIDALKNSSALSFFRAINFRKILVVVQFIISFILVSVLMTIYKQSKYMASADYGFSMQNTISISVEDSSRRTILKDEFRKLPFVKSISSISDNFGFHATDIFEVKADGGLPVKLSSFYVDENVQKDMALFLIAGRNFKSEITEKGKDNIIINSKACELLGLSSPQNAINKIIWIGDSLPMTIIGVVNDFHYENFKQSISAMALRYDIGLSKILNIQLYGNPQNAQYDQLLTVWKKVVPFSTMPMVYLEEQLYKQQSHTDDILMMAFLCLVFLSIGCLGLLGISTYAIEIKSKEISIRKIVGASVFDIFTYFSRQYFLLLVIAALIGIPIGILGSSFFLRSFAYKVPITILSIGESILIVSIIAFLSFGIQIFRYSMASPVKHIR